MTSTTFQSDLEQLRNKLKEDLSVSSFAAVQVEEKLVGFTGSTVPVSLNELRGKVEEGPIAVDELHILSLQENESLPDEKELEELHKERLRRRAPYFAPETETERYLSNLWGDRLGFDRIGREDDFFRLGGHSMLAVQIRLDVDRDIGVLLAAEAFFKNGRLRDLAEAIDQEAN